MRGFNVFINALLSLSLVFSCFFAFYPQCDAFFNDIMISGGSCAAESTSTPTAFQLDDQHVAILLKITLGISAVLFLTLAFTFSREIGFNIRLRNTLVHQRFSYSLKLLRPQMLTSSG